MAPTRIIITDGDWAADAKVFVPRGTLPQNISGLTAGAEYTVSNTGTSGVVMPLMPTANLYVDSLTGSDANDGATEDTAFATLGAAQTAALAFGNGASVGLARGSFWREALSLGGLSGITVRGYGPASEPLPKIDCADVANNGDFTLTSGQTNVYQISWTHTVSAIDKHKLRMWLDGAPLKWVASVALCAAEAGTFHVRNDLIETPATLYVHSTGSTNPATDGKAYEITRRNTAISVGAAYDVRDVHTTRNAAHDGSFIGGLGGYGENILSSQGVVHNQWVSVGSTHVGCVAYLTEPSTWRGLNATQFITYLGDGGVQITTYRNCWAYSDSPAANTHTAIYAHTNGGAARLGGMVVEGFRGYGPAPQITPANIDALSVADSLLEYLPGRAAAALGIGASGIVTEVDNVVFINGARIFGSGAVNAQDVRAYINGDVSGGVFFSVGNRLRSSTFVFAPALMAVNSPMFNTTGSAVEVLDTVISDAGHRQVRAAAANDISADRNVYYAEAAFGSFAIGASNGLQFTADWKPQTGQDANTAAVANTGLPICVDAPNGNFALARPIVDEGGRTAGSRRSIARPDWAAMAAAWEAGFIAPVA